VKQSPEASDIEVTLLGEAIGAAREIALFTGAGISTECGVPDFRSPGSPWLVNKPIAFDAFCADAAVRAEAWRRKFIMDDHFAGAKPGKGHRALAQLVSSGRARGVITQNIDNLHQDSGIGEDSVIELHGNGTYATCLDCRRRHELSDIRRNFMASGVAPVCDDCAGPVKAATVSFGQAMPDEALKRATDWALSADLFLAIGSSLVVNPAARLPVLARRNGAKLIIINAESTPLDAAASHALRSDIGALLNEVMYSVQN
jgi:NAD-dependent deacetylase